MTNKITNTVAAAGIAVSALTGTAGADEMQGISCSNENGTVYAMLGPESIETGENNIRVGVQQPDQSHYVTVASHQNPVEASFAFSDAVVETLQPTQAELDVCEAKFNSTFGI